MEEKIKKKTIISTLSLFFQSGYSAFLGLIANLILTILLTPKIFGIYFTVLSIISILNYFSDIGLAASLIQKKEINDKEVKTVFTFQQILILSIITLGFLATNWLLSFYQLPKEGKYLYWSLLFSFFLSSLKTIPSIFLERKIQFQKIVLVQIVENTFFYLTVIILAFLGLKLTSFTFAVFLRSFIGVILIYLISPWKIGFSLDFNILKGLLKFGIPFQASSLLALIKDDLLTLYLGKALGFQVLGYLGWAKKWAEAPIRIIMDSLNRVLFPLFSKLQEDKEKVKKVIEKTIFFQSSIILPSIFGLMVVINQLVFLIPKYNKWAQALPFFYLFCFSSLFSSYSTPFINLLNGLGKIKISFYFMIFWTIATWILTPILTFFYQGFGFPLTLVILSSSFIFVVYLTKKIINFQFIKNVFPFLTSSLFMYFFLFLIKDLFPKNFFFLSVNIFIGIISYLLILLIFFKINMIKIYQTLYD